MTARNICPLREDVTRAAEFGSFVPSFDVYFGTNANNLNMVCSDVLTSGCGPGLLECGTIYYCRVVATNHCGQTEGPLWWFTTEPPGDLDHDCDVDLLDYAALGAHWMAGDCDVGNNRCSGADLSGDKVLDFNDLRAFVAHWLSGN